MTTICDDATRPTNGRPRSIIAGTSLDLPAHDPAAEFAMAAAEFYQPGILVLHGLRREHFYTSESRELVGVAEALTEAGAVPSVEMLRHFLAMPENSELFSALGGPSIYGGSVIIDRVDASVAAPFHARYYAEKVRDGYARRQLKEQALSVARKTSDMSLVLAELAAELGTPIPEIPSRRFSWLTAAGLDAGDFQQPYLIPGILAAGQPGGIYGAFKSLKTSIAADLFLSLATGSPFLRHFPVTSAVPVAFMSGESGLAALQSVARRICTARGWSLDQVDGFHLTSTLPRLDNLSDMKAIERFIVERGIKAIGIDPAYLCMDVGDDAGNLFLMGKFLKPWGELCQSTGCTGLIVHHNKRAGNRPDKFAPAELSDIAWSGFAEFSAQWLMLSRRSAFDPETGEHELWLNAGGRAGHCGLYGVDVREGRFDDAGGRVWETKVHRASETRTAAVQSEAERREAEQERKQAETIGKDKQMVVDALQKFPEGETPRTIRDASRLSGSRFTPAIMDLEADGAVERIAIKKATGTYDGYRLKNGRWDKVGQGGTNVAVPIYEEKGGTRDSYRESQSHLSSSLKEQGGTNLESCPTFASEDEW